MKKISQVKWGVLALATVMAMGFGYEAYAELAIEGYKEFKDITVEQRPMAELTAPQSTMKVDVWVDRDNGTYTPGEKVKLYVKTNQDAYVTVLDVATSGKVHVIYPNQHSPANQLKANQVLEIPGQGASYDFSVGGPPGTELIKVIATKAATTLLRQEHMAAAGPFKALNLDAATVAKDLSVVLREGKSDWAEQEKVINVVAAVAGGTPQPTQPVVAIGGTMALATASVEGGASERFELNLRAERDVYRPGEAMKLLATPARDCYLTLVDIGTSGKASVIFPNPHQTSNLVKAGQTVAIPGDNAPVDFKVGGPGGVETVMGVCRTNDKPVFTAQAGTKGIGDAQSVAKDLSVVLRQSGGAIGHTATTFLVAP